MELKNFDVNMQILKANLTGIAFHSPDSPSFRLDGFAFRRPGMPFSRLPEPTAECPFTEALIGLGNMSAGGMLSFRSNTRRIVIKCAFSHTHRICRMAETGGLGFDLYVKQCGKFTFRNVTSFDVGVNHYCVDLFHDPVAKMREFQINFPILGAISQLEIGLEENAETEIIHPWDDPREIVAYGTSILHGACANRPGMAYPAILSRLLKRPVLNFGFSGNGKGEPFMAETLAKISHPALYLLDYDPNCSPERTEETLPTFIQILRAAHPDTPILTVSRIPFPQSLPENASDGLCRGAEPRYEHIHRKIVQSLRNAGDKNVHFVSGTRLLPGDYSEYSVDGCHLSDAGFLSMARELAPILEGLLA